ncbi:hypothetical protein [Lacrimispora sp.]|uniref:hypothetical protein n=1 Tax=Lacrimispora sp. TaxID=2719234 RepID=UPI0034601DCB
MNIKIYPGTLIKDEVDELGRLLFKAGYKVGKQPGKVICKTAKGGSVTKSVTVITFEDQQGEEESEDLS